jgi:hypothetical protein
MRPYGFDDQEQLRYTHAHAEALREDWRRANFSSRVGAHTSREAGPIARVRTRAGAVLIDLGRRLLAGSPGSEPRSGAGAAVRRADSGC